jgi:hypothetical protein
VTDPACRRNWITLYCWIGGKLFGFRFRLRSFMVTNTAQAVKLMHPNNKTNLIIVLSLQNSISLMPRYRRSTLYKDQCTISPVPINA